MARAQPGERRRNHVLGPCVLAAAVTAAATAGSAALRFTGGAPKAPEHSKIAARAQWDMQRFSRTVSFFKGSPWKLLLPKFLQSQDIAAPRSNGSQTGKTAELTIIDWGEQDGMPLAETWGQLDDVVMGGVSNSRLFATTGEERRLVFEGTTSRENNGGFCSFRSRLFSPPFNLSAFDGLAFTAKCRDGLRYKLQLRDNTGWDSIGYSVAFDAPSSQEEEVKLPFSSLVANFRSKTNPDAPPINLESIQSVQFVLSAFEFDKAMNPKFKEGEFHLELGPVRAYRETKG